MICRSPRDLPSLGALMEEPRFVSLAGRYGEVLLKAAAREVLSGSRTRLLQGETVELGDLVERVEALLLPAQRRVLNLTGTILHTNLGRAPLGDLLPTVSDRLRGYSVLEYDLSTGKRGQRGEAVERLLRWATGAEAALVVNNCSAALILLLTVLASGREVIVSRGELVEIGGGFRVPDILALSGAKLVEVGTTNRTRISDYEKAITEETALLLSTHRSNFQIVGFTQTPAREELLELGARHGLPVVYDLGSGMLTPVVQAEPSVRESVGFSLTAFSGDKLLGGPQCGILMGRQELVEQCRRHPFYRAFRCDKVTLALLEEVLRRHLTEPATVPTLQLITADVSSLRRRAEHYLASLPADLEADVVDSTARVGGGSLPGGELPSAAVRLRPARETARALQARFRAATVPIIVRLERECVVLDFRTLPEEEDQELLSLTREVLA